MSATIPCSPDLPGPSRPESGQPKTRETWYRKAIALAEERYEDYLENVGWRLTR